MKRIIFTYGNGEKRYVTHNGRILSWDPEDIAAFEQNVKEYGLPVVTSDFQQYDVTFKALRSRFPCARILRVVGYEIVSAYEPPRKGVNY